ncbi:hypothetical protein TSOC_008695 [Tetrabaena socialis]|uniref:Uncharacterized protein n=1 Tax=Tetrabaena socialis TaxID=47790 RepID=A0A2J7ZXU0_9CHLO|nr:hypothetical protein TSOC_008695 [Tetrabaena socialis]|eukprot:PNH05087.1 hypothetical protein TSOC_008695 [Tetrabaena socialis]
MARTAHALWRAARATAAQARPFSTAAAAASAATASASPASHAAAAAWTLTLERGIGKSYGEESELQSTGAFAAEVFPDLPIATTWQNLAKALRGGLTAPAADDRAPPFSHYATRPGALKVITAAANLRSARDIEQRVVEAAGEGAEQGGGQRAGALLCVSGSHPASLGATVVLTQPPLDWPAYLEWLDDAERRGLLLPAPPPGRAAARAAAAPSSLPLAGAAPPTPPPPAPPSPAAVAPPAAAELGGGGGGASSGAGGGGVASGSGGGGPLRLLVGHPVASSAANLTFWVSLSGCGGSAAARRLIADAARAEVEGRAAAVRHVQAYNRRLVEQVLSRGGVAGMHVMPITRGAKKMVMQMLEDGSLPRSA